ncbi:hypothetical protein [Demequina sp.]|uniref:hypothetical protein n=1 Tax=Demequina sp. TaxID=2050685 RepID=UPI003A8BB590
MLLKLRLRHDGGQALVMVIGLMLIMAIVVTVIVSSVVFGVGNTTQTRASVQSVAAAEAGVDLVGAAIMNGECEAVVGTDGLLDMTSSAPSYEVRVLSQDTSTGGMVERCPTESDYAFKVVSTGYASSPGTLGYDLGDNEVLEALWLKTTPPPRFEDAVRGDVYIGTAGVAGILSDDGDANVYTVGNFYCPAGATIEGSVVAGGSATWTQSNCRVTGDLYVGGDLIYPVGPGTLPNVGKDLYVVGDIMRGTGVTPGNFFRSNSGNQYMNVGGIVRVGGNIDSYCDYGGHETVTDWSDYVSWGASACVGGGYRVQKDVPGLSVGDSKGWFPVTTETEPYASWTEMQWATMSATTDPGSVPDGRRVDGSTCTYHPWNGKGVINVTEDTFIDTTDVCNTVNLGSYGGVTINLSADLAIYADHFYANGPIEINSVDGEKHSLYLIDPVESESFTCPAVVADPGPSTGGFHFSSGTWDQDPEIAVLAYTPGKFVAARSDFTLGGQVYSCQSEFVSGFYLDFRRVGDEEATSTMSSFDIEYLRRSS